MSPPSLPYWPLHDREPFELAFERIKRAHLHHKAAGDAWDAFLNEQPYAPVVHVDDDGLGEIWISMDRDRLPLEIGLELGEMLYQLRAALDSCVYDAAVYETGKYPPQDETNLEFPICESTSTFIKSGWKIKPLPKEYRDFIEAMQPCKTPEVAPELAAYNINQNLGILNDWARKDRHRFLHVARSWAANRDPLLHLPPGVELDWLVRGSDDHLENNPQIASFKLVGWSAGMDLEANPNFTIDVAIDEPPPPRNDQDTLGNRTRNIATSVEMVVLKFQEISRRKISV
ncbi:MAG: hypothetical protein ACYDHE_20300 [Candidatus Acidiferrales bacterium]